MPWIWEQHTSENIQGMLNLRPFTRSPDIPLPLGRPSSCLGLGTSDSRRAIDQGKQLNILYFLTTGLFTKF